MAHKANILVKKPDQLIPADLQTKICEAYPTAFAVAFQGDNEDEVDFLYEEGKVTPEVIGETMDSYKQAHCWYLLKSDQQVLEDDQQPFVLIESEDEKPLLVAFINGDFVTYAKTDSSHTNEYHFATEFLLDAVCNVYDECQEDLDKTLTVLDSPKFREKLQKEIVGEGRIVLIPFKGQFLTFSKDKAQEYDWGLVTDECGYEEEKPEKALTLKERRELRKKGAAAAVTKPATEAPAPKTVLHLPQKDTETRLPNDAGKEEFIDVPDQGSGKALRGWWHRNVGHTKPKDWQVLKQIPISWLRKDAPVLTGKEKIKSFGEAADAIASKGIVDSLPIIPPSQREAFKAKFITSVESQEELDKLEEVFESFEEMTGHKMEDVLRWPAKAYNELIKDWPKAAWCLLNEFRFDILGQKKKAAPIVPPKEEEKVEEKPMTLKERREARKMQRM
jgi:hypothetical protein